MILLSVISCFRLAQSVKEYAELEDEFRMALQIEADRFQSVSCVRYWIVDTSEHVYVAKAIFRVVSSLNLICGGDNSKFAI